MACCQASSHLDLFTVRAIVTGPSVIQEERQYRRITPGVGTQKSLGSGWASASSEALVAEGPRLYRRPQLERFLDLRSVLLNIYWNLQSRFANDPLKRLRHSLPALWHYLHYCRKLCHVRHDRSGECPTAARTAILVRRISFCEESTHPPNLQEHVSRRAPDLVVPGMHWPNDSVHGNGCFQRQISRTVLRTGFIVTRHPWGGCCRGTWVPVQQPLKTKENAACGCCMAT
jgi:hypothetical protein